MSQSDYVRLFARDVGLAPQIGGAETVQDALATGAGGFLRVVRYPFNHVDHAALTAGVLAATLPSGAVTFRGMIVVSVPVAWNGTTPALSAACSQADAVADNNTLVSGVDLTTSNSQVGLTNMYELPTQTTTSLVAVGPGEVWIAVTDGSGGDPGSTVGAGEIVVAYIS